MLKALLNYSRIFQRADFQKNPLKAIAKRVIWRLRWVMTKKPWNLNHKRNFKIYTPHGGTGALIYYLGESEPEVSEFIINNLKPGHVFIDIGAHIGEYSLLASKLVGPKGLVFGFEPSQSIYQYLKDNIFLNACQNVTLENYAVSDHIGVVNFHIHNEQEKSSIVLPETQMENMIEDMVQIRSISLDNYFKNIPTTINMIKMDVEGAELLVLKGATRLLDCDAETAPIWIFECSPENYHNFGYSIKDVFHFFSEYGYRIYSLNKEKNYGDKDNLEIQLGENSINMIAIKE